MVGILHGDTGPIESIAFSPDGTTLASGSADGTARLWNVATHQQVGSPLTAITPCPVTSVAFSLDGQTLAGGGDYGTVQLWDVATHDHARFPADLPTPTLSSIAISPDGRTLAAGGDGGRVRLWDVPTRSQLGSPLTATIGSVTSVAFSPDGRISGRRWQPRRRAAVECGHPEAARPAADRHHRRHCQRRDQPQRHDARGWR